MMISTWWVRNRNSYSPLSKNRLGITLGGLFYAIVLESTLLNNFDIMNIITNQSELLAFVRDELNSEKNLSIRGVARLCGVKDTSIIRGAAFSSVNLSQKLIGQGFDAAALAENGFCPKAVWLTIEYFAYESKAKAEMAKQIARTFGMIGVITTFEELTKEPVIEKSPELPRRDVIEYVQAQKDIEAINNLTLQELLRDQLIDELSILRGKALPRAKTKEYTIGKVRARELGYTTKEIGNGSALGRFLAKNVPVAYVERVGKHSTNHYEVDDQLDTAIKTYFGLKSALK